VTDDDWGSARYEIRLDEHGNPQLVPATTLPATDGFGSGAVAGGAGSSIAAGEVSDGGPGYAAASELGRMASGSVSFDSGPADVSADGSARLASASTASDSGTANAPGGAQLASAAEESRVAPPAQGGAAGAPQAQGGTAGAPQAQGGTAGAPQAQGGTAGAPFMPLGGAVGGGGDQERQGSGMWQVPGADVFEAEDEPVAAQGVLGEDR
jgi:hypothetical protein